MKSVGKILSVALAGAMALSMTACGGGNSSTAASTAGSGAGSTAASTAASTDKVPTIDKINLGTDYKDLKANLKVLTDRTDIVNTTMADLAKKFKEMYPNITIKYEAVNKYADDVTNRLATKDWGDICLIPDSVNNSELADYFEPFGKVDEISKIYMFASAKPYEGTAYGIGSCGDVKGIVYNKKVFKDAGITELPKTPDEYIKDLKQIKEKTKAIPLYTNYHDSWCLGQLDGYVNATSTGDATFRNQKMAKMKDPFSKTAFADGTGPYAVYNIFYTAVKNGLTETDPNGTNWDKSKPMLNRGEIASMILGSWATKQCIDADKNGSDVASMPFPITINGKQYTSASSGYCYGLNKNSSTENKIAAMVYVKWLTEKSNFAYDQGGLPMLKGAPLPDCLKSFEKTEIIEDAPAKSGEEDLFKNINNDSELGIGTDNKHVQDIVEAARKGDKTMDDLAKAWNEQWAKGQQANNVKVS